MKRKDSERAAKRRALLHRCLITFAVGLLLLAGLVGAISLQVAQRRGIARMWWPNGIVLVLLVGSAFVHVKGAAAPSSRWGVVALVSDLVVVYALAGWQLTEGDVVSSVMLAGIGSALGVPLLVTWSRVAVR